MIMKTKILIILAIVLLLVIFWAKDFNSEKTGYIKIDTPGFDTSLDLRSGYWGKKTIRSSDGAVSVPAGTYKPGHAKLVANKGKKNDLTISHGSGMWGDLASIKVEKGETKVVKLGPPFLIKTDVQLSRSRKIVSVGFSIVGQAGE